MDFGEVILHLTKSKYLDKNTICKVVCYFFHKSLTFVDLREMSSVSRRHQLRLTLRLDSRTHTHSAHLRRCLSGDTQRRQTFATRLTPDHVQWQSESPASPSVRPEAAKLIINSEVAPSSIERVSDCTRTHNDGYRSERALPAARELCQPIRSTTKWNAEPDLSSDR